jgi:hypothetical protein
VLRLPNHFLERQCKSGTRHSACRSQRLDRQRASTFSCMNLSASRICGSKMGAEQAVVACSRSRRDVSTQTLYDICQAVDDQIRAARRLCHLRRKHIHSDAQCLSLRLIVLHQDERGSKRLSGFTLVAPNLNQPRMSVVGAPPPPLFRRAFEVGAGIREVIACFSNMGPSSIKPGSASTPVRIN